MSSTGQEIPSFTKLAHTAGEGIKSNLTAVSDSVKENMTNMKDKFDDNVGKPINDTIERKAEEITAEKKAAARAIEREKPGMLERASTNLNETMTSIKGTFEDKVTKPINDAIERKAEEITAAKQEAAEAIEREKPGMLERASTNLNETMTSIKDTFEDKVTKPINDTIERKAEEITAAKQEADKAIEREKPGMLEKIKTSTKDNFRKDVMEPISTFSHKIFGKLSGHADATDAVRDENRPAEDFSNEHPTPEPDSSLKKRANEVFSNDTDNTPATRRKVTRQS